jgi:hypothetical protein
MFTYNNYEGLGFGGVTNDRLSKYVKTKWLLLMEQKMVPLNIVPEWL